jgi:hypothetical protein
MYPTRSRPKNNENAGLLICEMQIEKKERKKKKQNIELWKREVDGREIRWSFSRYVRVSLWCAVVQVMQLQVYGAKYHQVE